MNGNGMLNLAKGSLKGSSNALINDAWRQSSATDEVFIANDERYEGLKRIVFTDTENRGGDESSIISWAVAGNVRSLPLI
jgi:hypothetical protein